MEDLMPLLADNLKRRRLERGLSRDALSAMSGVPTATIARFEQKHAVSLRSYVAMARALGYASQIKSLMESPIYGTMDELLKINRNKNRQRGRNEFKKDTQ